MADKTETTITRPNIFPECRACIVARRIIDAHLAYQPSLPFVSIQTTKVDVACEVTDETVALSHKAEYMIQFRPSKIEMAIPAGNVSPEKVRCPHFSGTIQGRARPVFH